MVPLKPISQSVSEIVMLPEEKSNLVNSPEIGVGGPPPEPPCWGAWRLITWFDTTSSKVIESSSLVHDEKIIIKIRSL